MELQNINDDYFVIALHIFESCGSQENEFLPATTLMDVMAPFIGCDKSEYAILQSLLDPDKIDPVISVNKLSSALQEYSLRHNSKIDNCFGVVNSNVTIESSISIEGYRELLADLQCELREKTHLIAKLKQQMEFSDKQHDEVLASLTVERDSLQAHLQLIRDENTSLMYFKNGYDEMSEWSHSTREQLAENNVELDALRKKTKALQESVEKLESEKQILTEKIVKCQEEYQKMNDIYDAKKAILSVDNEMLKGKMADLSARFDDQNKNLLQAIKEKLIVEEELKDILNRSNDVACFRLNRSIDVSYSDSSMLRILDSMNQSNGESKSDESHNSSHSEFVCPECTRRSIDSVEVQADKLKALSYLRLATKNIFQFFAMLCFLLAVFALYNITHYHFSARRCIRSSSLVPWDWMSIQDVISLILKIEYVGEVPM